MKFSIAYKKSDFDEGKKLFRAYAEALSFDLAFQNFEKELKNIKQQYASPESALILCYDRQEAVGCVAIRKIDDQIAELKRFYVHPQYRGLKIGKQLLELAIDKAKELDYTFIRLDSAPEQSKAQGLYKAFGFYEIAPYGYNPLEGVVYMECALK
ncbi:GNAT family N-acetyltransferase [marine bacterium AO1-C]|nr:GNAT family N-acetyltransferase [marine bacterium AO1-C]